MTAPRNFGARAALLRILDRRAARADAIRHMWLSGVRRCDLNAAGISNGAIFRALPPRFVLATKAVRS